MRLSDTELQQYREEGFFVRESVFSTEDLDRFRMAAERVVAAAAESSAAVTLPATDDLSVDASDASEIEIRLEETDSDYRIDGNRYVETGDATVQFEHDGESQTIRVIEPFHHLDPVFDELVQDPRIVTPICGVLGFDRVALWTDKINLKRPREGSGYRWHQDSPYWSHVCDHCDQLPNVMIALDDADRGNGCFRVVPGSHRDGFLPGLADGTRLGPLFTDPASFDVDTQWLAEVPAGSLVIFDAHTVHGSEPNLSDRPRRAIVLTYQPADNPMFKANGTRNFSISGSAFESAPGSPDQA
jgi:ectoine hydroxylase